MISQVLDLITQKKNKMNTLDLIEEHIIVRETVGYEILNNIEIEDIPEVIKFLKIIYNYKRMTNLKNKSK